MDEISLDEKIEEAQSENICPEPCPESWPDANPEQKKIRKKGSGRPKNPNCPYCGTPRKVEVTEKISEN